MNTYRFNNTFIRTYRHLTCFGAYMEIFFSVVLKLEKD